LLEPYAIEFMPRARKAWSKLPHPVKEQLARRLAERQQNPHVASARLSRMPNCYKIKLRGPRLRLVCRVEEQRLVILVLAIGKRERNEAYQEADRELRRLDDRS